MTRTALVGFVLTVGALVPAGWHLLGANIEVDGKHLRPLVQSLELEGATVTLVVDRTVVMTGDAITATLVATSDTVKTIDVDVRTLHTTNYAGERVERPWVAIDRETLHLPAAPGGGKPVATRITLGKRPAKLGLEDSFKIVVTEHGATIPVREYDVRGDARDFDALVEKHTAAAIAVRGWSGNSLGMTVAARGPVVADKPFTIAVTIRNTTGRTLDHVPYINLTTEAALTAKSDDADDALLAIDRDAVSNDMDEVEPGAKVTRTFTITPHGKLASTITFLAEATENDGLGPYGAGAMDAVTIHVAEPAPAGVASK